MNNQIRNDLLHVQRSQILGISPAEPVINRLADFASKECARAIDRGRRAMIRRARQAQASRSYRRNLAQCPS